VRPIEKLGFVSIVIAASHFDVRNGRRTPNAMRIQMVELQEAAFGAAMAVFADEDALLSISLPDLALQVGSDVARSGRARAPWPRSVGRSELLLFDRRQEQRQGTIEDGIVLAPFGIACRKRFRARISIS
jgi:hypothetical protein